MTNRFGLSRHIPADIARDIRRRSRFGCIMCRCAIYQYEHIVPVFADAREHDPNAICLLCGTCHHKVTSNRLSKQTVHSRYLEIQAASSPGRPHDKFDLASPSISVSFGSARFAGSKSLIRINGQDLLSITLPVDGASQPTLNGCFCDQRGNEIFSVSDNLWEGPLDAWDIISKGPRTIIKVDRRRDALIFNARPPDAVIIETLDMYKDNCHIICDEKRVLVGQLVGKEWTYIGLSNFECEGACVAISVDSTTGDVPKLKGIRMAGGSGILLEGTGITIGVGAGRMTIDQLKVWTS